MDVEIPDNYRSLDHLANWLRKHIPHEVHRLNRWEIVRRSDDYYIWFRNPADATLFALLS